MYDAVVALAETFDPACMLSCNTTSSLLLCPNAVAMVARCLTLMGLQPVTSKRFDASVRTMVTSMGTS